MDKDNRQLLVQQLFTDAEMIITVADAYTQFIRHVKSKRSRGKSTSPQTIATYEKRLRLFIKHYGHLDLRQLRVDHIDEWYGRFLDQSARWIAHPTRAEVSGGLSNSTLRGYVQSIKAFMNFCDIRYGDELEWKRLPTHSLIKPPPTPKRLRNNGAMNPDDFKLMLLEAERSSQRDYAMVALLGDTAMRLGELTNLRISDMNLEYCTAIVEGKTDEREVDYTEDTADIVREWLKMRPNCRHDFVFIAQHGKSKNKPLTIHGIYLVLKRLAKRTRIQGRWNPQAIRIMVGQLWADNGVNIERIQLKLGHKDVKTTLEFYTHQDRERVKQTTRKLSLISPKSKS